MRRSQAPSALYEKYVGPSEEPPKPEETGDDQKKKRGRKKAEPEAPVNPMKAMMDWYFSGLKEGKFNPLNVEKRKEEEAEESKKEESDEDTTKKGKNVVMDQKSPPLFFAVHYNNKQKSGDTGFGSFFISSDSVQASSKLDSKELSCTIKMVAFECFDPLGKKLNETPVVRSEYDNGDPKVTIKKKEVFFQSEFSCEIGNRKAKLLEEVKPEDFESGRFFLKDRKQIEKELKKAQKERPK
jgi:hypothetical protein